MIELKNLRKLFYFAAAFVGFFLIHFLSPFESKANLGLALTFVVAFLWVTEAIPLTVTALMIPVLSMMIGLQNPQEAFLPFADPIIFLFLGGFGIAAVLQTQKIDQLLALKIIQLARGNLKLAILMLFALTAFLSMWISNMATAALMLPVVMGLFKAQNPNESTKAFSVLGVAHSATLGGLLTVLGSPPNAIAAAELGLDFWSWMKVVAPLGLFLLVVCWILLFQFFKPQLESFNQKAGPVLQWTFQRKLTAFVFVTTALSWIFSQQLSSLFGLGFNLDSFIAITALVLVVLLGLVTWEEIQSTTEWGVLILFGGGLSLSQILLKSGASQALTESLVQILSGVSPYFLILAIVLFIVFLTELTSNTATAALLIPLLQPLSGVFDMELSKFVLMIAVAASCGFMLPVATPPNTLAYSTKWIPQRQMIRLGFRLNLISIAAITFYFIVSSSGK